MSERWDVRRTQSAAAGFEDEDEDEEQDHELKECDSL